MPFDFNGHRQRLVDHLIRLEALDPTYAKWALEQARREPSGLYRDLLQDVRAEQERRAAVLSEPLSSPTATPSDPTPTA